MPTAARRHADKKPCVRCGYRYEPRKGKPGLCPSCKLTVPEEEKPKWTS